MISSEKLTAVGEPGTRRLADPEGRPQFTEDSRCKKWIILSPIATWQEWRALAWMILESGDPGED
jgi:hypothetical protein